MTGRERLRELFSRARDRPAGERAELLEREAADDPRLRTTLERLLEEADRNPELEDDDLFARPIVDGWLDRVDDDAAGVGDTIGSVRLEEVLGEGGMGTVFRGLDEKLGRPVAVKTVRSDRRFDAATRARFRREARILSRLNHPAICQIYDLVERPEADYLLLEYVEGRTLASDDGPETGLAERLRVARDLADALAAAHSQGVVHRDLKPDNVMVTAQGRVKVLDFGIARAAEPGAAARPGSHAPRPVDGPETDPRKETLLTRHGSVLGTVAYMSPEQARGDEVTAASDVYSLGLILRELFTGRRVRRSLPARELLERARSGDLPPADGLPAELVALDSAMLSPQPDDRPTAVDVARELDAIAAAPQRRRRRRRATVAALAGVALAMVTGVGAWRLARPAPLLAAGQEAAVALLPIENRTGDDGLDWIGAGLTELVVRQLDHLESVRVLPLERLRSRLDALGTLPPAADLPRSLGVDLAFEARALADGDAIEIEYRVLRPAARPSPWRGTAAAEPTRAADLLARALALRLSPDAPPVEMRDRFSADPSLNRLYALGLDRLHRAGGGVATSYFRVCVDREPAFGWARLQLGRSLFGTGDAAAATEEAREAERIAGRSGDRSLLAAARILRAQCLAHQGETGAAETLARQAVEASRAGEDSALLAEALTLLGQVAWERGDLDAAERLQTEAIAIERRIDDPIALARSLRALGVVADTRWELDRAIDLFREALAAIETRDVPALRASILNSLGISLHYAGDLESAGEALGEALGLNRRIGNRSAEASNLTNLGDLALRRRDWEGAAETLASALEIFDAIGMRRGIVASRLNLSFALIRIGRLDEAEAHLDEVARLGAGDDWNTFGNRGLLAYARGDFERALELWERSKELAGPNWNDGFERTLLDMRASAADGLPRDLS